MGIMKMADGMNLAEAAKEDLRGIREELEIGNKLRLLMIMKDERLINDDDFNRAIIEIAKMYL